MGIREQWESEKASDWTVKPSALKLEPIGKSRNVAKTFNDIMTANEDADDEIALVVATWTDTDGIYAEVEKGNPYRDPDTGKFTTGPASGNPMIRTAPPPKKTKIAYKVFVAKDGKLYPPMVANPDGQATPVGVWLDASEGTLATDKDGNPITNTLGRNKVKAGGKGTQGGSGTLAYRPGWHLGELPIAEQFYTKDKATGEKKQKKNFVWAECEIAADFDYQTEAMSYGYNKNGKFQHSLAGLPKIPTDGYYTYRTNPDPKTKPWYITGAMKVNRILTDAETNSILRSNGIEPMKRMGGELDLAALGFTETNFVGKSASEENAFNIFKTDEDKRLVFGWASISMTVDGEQLEDRQQDMIDPEDLEEAAYEYVLNFRDTGEEHIPTMRKKGKLVESCVLTAEKQKAMGIPEGTVPVGWWIGFKISDDDAWNRVKSGHYKMFSIEGQAHRLPVEKSAPVAKSFDDILKYNDNHDELGRFAPKGGGAASSVSSEQREKMKELLRGPSLFAPIRYRREIGMSDDEYNELYQEIKGKPAPKARVAKPTEPKAESKPPKKQENPEDQDDYRMSHRPDQCGAGYDLTSEGMMPNDFYDKPWQYANKNDPATRESFEALKKIRNKPDAEVTIYRASPKNEFNDGDWVTLSPTYAERHKEHSSTGNLKLEVHTMKVKAKDIAWAGDDINEFGYFPFKKSLNEGGTTLSRYDNIKEVGVAKTFDEIIEVQKFNPYHDAKGRFSSANNYASFTYSPGKSKAHDMAISRHETRAATAASSTDTSDAAREIAGGKHNSLEGYLDENGKLTPEREAVHQEIINKMLRDKVPVDGQATMTMLGGGPASGKSSVLNPDTSGDPHSVTIDPDAMKAMLPGYKEMAAKTSDAASYYHEESSALAKRFYEVAVSRNLNAIYDGTGDGSEASVQKKIDTARAAGHKVVAKYVSVDTETAVARNQKRYDDAVAQGKTPRLVPAQYVRNTHAKVTDISVAKASAFDEIEIWDNNGARGQQKLIAKGGNGSGLKAIDKAAFQKYLEKGNGYSMDANGGVTNRVIPS